MLYFGSGTAEGNFYQGLKSSKERITSVIVNSGKIEELQKFLRDLDINYILEPGEDSEGNSVINIRFKNRSVTTTKTLEKQNESYQKNNKLIFVFSSIAEFLLDYINSEEFPELDNSIENIIIDLWNDD